MSIESPSNEKTEQELFDEVSEALSKGKDIDSLLRNVSVTGKGEEPEVPEEPEEEETPPEEPADEPETEEADGTEPEAKKEEPAPPALPPDIQERMAKLEKERSDFEHRLRSDVGRIAALQRKVEELSRAQAAPQAAVPAEPAATTPSVAKSKFDEKIARVKEIDPELAELLVTLKEDVTESSRKEFTDRVSQTEELLRQKEEQEIWHKEKARLLEMVPQADEVFKNPLWKQWKESQPDTIRALASSMDADEMYLAMQKFATDTARMYPDLAVSAQTSTEAPADAPVSKVAADRARKLVVAAPPSGGVAPKQGKGIPDPSDEQAFFDYVVKKIESGQPIKF